MLAQFPAFLGAVAVLQQLPQLGHLPACGLLVAAAVQEDRRLAQGRLVLAGGHALQITQVHALARVQVTAVLRTVVDELLLRLFRQPLGIDDGRVLLDPFQAEVVEAERRLLELLVGR
ncbi:hypothetical protein FAF44_49670 [Nonomuraea sp. MG754425]|uniref:hypothetical protein n=1 Tax=Nonomuraea sp. MG754425 TaxID=2570319 RepID=UPI001F2E6DCA|nr:hypothetical protein [Nonomuraea sp. MG754425]MCF6476358.1 hypothetical protein [Nonomuraea sp. MG754425]